MSSLNPEQQTYFDNDVRILGHLLQSLSAPHREAIENLRKGKVSEDDLRRLLELDSGLAHRQGATRSLVRLAVEVSGISLQGWAEKQLREKMEKNPEEFVEQYLQKTLQDRFSSVTYISCGGMGMVIKAWDGKQDRWVALKFNLAIDDEKRKQCFLEEGKRASSIGPHPNVVTVYESAEIKVQYQNLEVSLPCVISEFVEEAQDGKALLKSLEGAEDFPREARIFLGLCAAIGLQAAHQKGLIHQDVKPNNFLVPKEVGEAIEEWKKSKNDRALMRALKKTRGLQLTDFGLAEVIQAQANAEGDMKGTPYFMAPEVLEGTSSPEPSRDVYALGIVLYQLIIGHQDPLSISKGVNPERGSGEQELAHLFIKIAAAKDRSPAISNPEKDPHGKRFVESGSSEERALNHKLFAGVQQMTAYEKTDRPALSQVIAMLEEQIEVRTKTAEVKALEQKKRMAIMTSGVLVIALLMLLFALPPFMKKGRKRKFSESGARLVQQYDGLICDNKWSEASELLKRLLQDIEKNEDLDEREQWSQKKALESRRAFVNGMLVIANDFLKRDPPDFGEARKVLKTIKLLTPGGTPIAEHMENHINESEVKVLLPQGMLAFWTGDFDKAREIFLRMEGLRDAGVSEETKAELAECRKRLEGVEGHLKILEQEVLESLGFEKNPNGRLKRKKKLNDEAWQNFVEGLLDEEESVNINRILIVLNILSQSSHELQDEVDQDRLKALFELLFHHAHTFEEHIRETPGALLKLQKHLTQFQENQQKEMEECLQKLKAGGEKEMKLECVRLRALIQRFLEAIAVSIRTERTLSGGDSGKIPPLIRHAQEWYKKAKAVLPKREMRHFVDDMHHSLLSAALLPYLEGKH